MIIRFLSLHPAARALSLILLSGSTGLATSAAVADELRAQELGLLPEETIAAMSSRTPEIDLDGDGRVDLWREFRQDGGISSAKYDNNGDGRPDETFFYEDNRVTRVWDEDGDGKEDRRFQQWKTSQGAVERTQLETLRNGKWEVVTRSRVLAGKDLIETRKNVNGREVISYDPATVR